MEIEVQGHQIVLREEFKAKETWPVFAYVQDQLTEGGKETYEGDVDVLIRVILSWDLDTDPHDPESYPMLDFGFFYDLTRAAARHLSEKLFLPKNSVVPPTSD